MDNKTLELLTGELAVQLANASAGRIFQLARLSVALEFRFDESNAPRPHRFLLLSVEAPPRLYLTGKRLRELEKQAAPLSPFALALRKQLAVAQLQRIEKHLSDRVVFFHFIARDTAEVAHRRTLVAQLTGRSSNLFLLDEQNGIIAALRAHDKDAGALYELPPPSATQHQARIALADTLQDFASAPSAALENYFEQLDRRRRFDALASESQTRLNKELQKRKTLQRNLESDIAEHGEPAEHKRIGDLILANLATAERAGTKVSIVDYYSNDTPKIEIEVDENSTLQMEAARRFHLFGKAKRARETAVARLAAVTTEIENYENLKRQLEQLTLRGDYDALIDFARLHALANRTLSTPKTSNNQATKDKARDKALTAKARIFRSSDGYEILVGRGARANDELTFRTARSNDLWLHAADYRGAHVIIRNHTRAEIPHRTVTEAAQLAALNSEARDDTKVAVNYTARKFVTKPKGAAPGLVRLASFKTLLVEPQESGERIA